MDTRVTRGHIQWIWSISASLTLLINLLVTLMIVVHFISMKCNRKQLFDVFRFWFLTVCRMLVSDWSIEVTKIYYSFWLVVFWCADIFILQKFVLLLQFDVQYIIMHLNARFCIPLYVRNSWCMPGHSGLSWTLNSVFIWFAECHCSFMHY